ncbi:hypothetical protein [Enterobacter bugandensis]|uniref:hypothetical protein n=1 Tax=Enterobacter bugandensis TaxID=881260 RepID=UPI002361E72D|nr:hypothetical protein [Enterobacter bugandensis]
MRISTIFVIMAISTTVSGCAVQNDHTQFNGLGLTYRSNVKQLKNGDYYTEVEASPAAGRISGASGAANKIASDYCKVKNKAMKEIKSETDSHLLINGVTKLTFRCV